MAGDSFNEINYGIGLEKSNFENFNEFYTVFGTALISDSFSNPFSFIWASSEIRFDTPVFDTALGISLFGGLKDIPHFVNTYNDEYEISHSRYMFTGGVAPSLKLFIGDFSLNLNYTPTFDFHIKDNHIYIP